MRIYKQFSKRKDMSFISFGQTFVLGNERGKKEMSKKYAVPSICL